MCGTHRRADPGDWQLGRRRLYAQPHTPPVYDAISHDDKELVEIKGATHYYIGQKPELAQAVNVIADWLERHDLV